MMDDEKPIQQKLRNIHPNLENQIKSELNKLLKAKIIFPIRHSKWISNMVPVLKKNGDIRICINFWNLSKAFQKDNFPLPPMEQILHAVTRSELMSFLDGFLRYNQVLVHPDDQLKTTFRTKWGTYAYQKMPFVLINVGATFQRAMDITFKGLVKKSVEYDVQIKPASIVKGQGFCKMLDGESLIPKTPSAEIQMYEVSLNDVESLYADIIFYLKNGYAPSNLNHTKKRALRLKAKQYQLVNDVLFRINYDSVLLRCLKKSEAEKVLQELHDGLASGHYAGYASTHKILRASYYWPTLFKDSHNYVRKCQVCQTATGRQKKPSLSLQPVNIEQPFDQWGLDIIGEIIPHSSK
eukprot:PITA_03913